MTAAQFRQFNRGLTGREGQSGGRKSGGRQSGAGLTEFETMKLRRILENQRTLILSANIFG